ncbi:DUF5071 domain-containing protein [Bacillus salipaludis]|uniref:DUF5071 domain-containing protein n=1 Tax=Bacillus salipaludis TaxID=2547811 RepID=UPI002E1F31F7|nr:DUF5071 domain-containing protein [Bacillus salipaludis]
MDHLNDFLSKEKFDFETVETEDDIWKFWCMEVLVKKLPSNSRKKLKCDLIRLAERPSEGENLEKVDVKVNEILKQL